MICGHPSAARAVRSIEGGLTTICWACEVEDSIAAESRERADRLRTYNRDAKRASRARAKGYNTVVGVSDDSATMRDDAASGAYSTGGRVAAFSPGVRR